jgi:hypothetical protein
LQPLLTQRVGKSVRVKRAARNRGIWSPEDFARQFLEWLVATDPKFRNSRVCVPDIESDLLPRFKAENGCPKLQLGTLLRGLRNVSAGKHENVPYLDPTGRRRTMTEYEVRKKQDS